MLKYLLRDPNPPQNAFKKVKGTYDRKHGMGGWWNPELTTAVIAYKYRIGYPARGQCKSTLNWRSPEVGPYFIALLRGKKNRPYCWVALAQHRLKLAAAAEPTPGSLRLTAWEFSQVGVYETSYNAGPVVDRYQRYFGFYRQPWCAIFQNYGLLHVGLPRIGAPNPFYVPSVAVWAQHYGYLNAKARRGSFVIYLKDNYLVDSYHIGYVVRVTASGYWSIEGNYANGVRERYTPFGNRLRMFVYLPYLVKP